MQTLTAFCPVRPTWQKDLKRARPSVRPFSRYMRTSASKTIASEEGSTPDRDTIHPSRRTVNGAMLLGLPISLILPGVAIAGTSADAVKELDPSITTVSPPKIGDAVESMAKVAGSTMESSPPSDVGQALKEGVTRMEVPDPLKTVLPGKNSGFNVSDRVSGTEGESRGSPNKIRNTIVDKALTDQSPKRNFEK